MCIRDRANSVLYGKYDEISMDEKEVKEAISEFKEQNSNRSKFEHYYDIPLEDWFLLLRLAFLDNPDLADMWISSKDVYKRQAYYLKNKNYDALSYTLSKTYFVGRCGDAEVGSFDVFYDNNESLDRAVSQKDDKNYYSGTASYWINNINIEVCNKNEFVFADIFCHNASLFLENYTRMWFWFPITYIYDRTEYRNSLFRQFAIRLKSTEHLHEAAKMMGYSDTESFKKKYIEIERKMKEGIIKEYR